MTWVERDHPRWPRRTGKGGEFREAWVREASTRLDPASRRQSHHALPRTTSRYAQGMWGASRSGSFALAGTAARIMGIPGYRDSREDSYFGGTDRERQANAVHFLRRIFEGRQRGAVERYHITSDSRWKSVEAGQTVDLSLTATDNSFSGFLSYADQDKPAYVVRFPPTTRMVGISETRDVDTNEPTGGWEEMVTAGRFEVESVRDVAESAPGSHWSRPYREIRLRQRSVFDPTTRQWRQLAGRANQ